MSGSFIATGFMPAQPVQIHKIQANLEFADNGSVLRLSVLVDIPHVRPALRAEK
jgi:hypothetical protein